MISRFLRAVVPTWLVLLVCASPGGAQSGASEVATSGSLSAHAIHENESLQFTLTIKNKADAKANPKASLQDLTLQGLPDGYVLDAEKPVCVLPLLPPKTQSCGSGANFELQHSRFLESLAPGQSVTVQGYLKPNPCSAHKSMLTVVIAWVAGDNGLASSQSASLGENQVFGIWERVLNWISELFKLLAIPAILALIGYWINFENRKRDEAFTKANRLHDEEFAKANREHDEAFAIAQINRQTAQHEHEQAQALRSETWKQMLPLSHNYAAKFYLPLSLAAQSLAKELKYPVAKPRLAFFYLLLCGKKMRATRNEIGGFYFKDLRGEKLAADCWETQRVTFIGEADDEFYKAVHAAIDCLDDEVDSFELFENEFVDTSTQPASFVNDGMEKAWGFFELWRAKKDEVEKTARYLTGFYAVLDYESNRPYEYWYDQKDSPAKLEITDETEKLLAEILRGKKYTAEQVASYFRGVVVRPEVK